MSNPKIRICFNKSISEVLKEEIQKCINSQYYRMYFCAETSDLLYRIVHYELVKQIRINPFEPNFEYSTQKNGVKDVKHIITGNKFKSTVLDNQNNLLGIYNPTKILVYLPERIKFETLAMLFTRLRGDHGEELILVTDSDWYVRGINLLREKTEFE